MKEEGGIAMCVLDGFSSAEPDEWDPCDGNGGSGVRDAAGTLSDIWRRGRPPLRRFTRVLPAEGVVGCEGVVPTEDISLSARPMRGREESAESGEPAASSSSVSDPVRGVDLVVGIELPDDRLITGMAVGMAEGGIPDSGFIVIFRRKDLGVVAVARLGATSATGDWVPGVSAGGWHSLADNNMLPYVWMQAGRARGLRFSQAWLR